MTTADLLADYETLRTGVGFTAIQRDVVRVTGPEAASFLQGQATQDILALAVGASALSFVLQPHGKVDAFVRVSRLDEDTFILDTDAGWGDGLVARLERFKLRTKAKITRETWLCLAIRGVTAVRVRNAAARVEGATLITDAHWRAVQGLDVFGPAVGVPEKSKTVSFDAFEVLRIEAGVPVMGQELDERTIPAEAGINRETIDFRKGCYTGQELVARIDARGNNVPRRLMGVVIEADEAPPRGATLVLPGAPAQAKPLGTLTSTAWSPRLQAGVALAYVRREIAAGATVALTWDDAETPARIVGLPMSVES